MTRRTVLIPALIAGAMLACVAAVLVVPAKEAGAAFSGENGRVVYAGFRGWDENVSLYSVDPDDGTQPRLRLTNNDGAPDTPQDFYPEIAPDGTRVAFLRTFLGGEDCVPYVVNMDGTGLQEIGDDDPGTCEGAPRWTTDGRIAVSFGGQTHVMNPDGTGRAPIGPETRVDDPALSPDGRKRVVPCGQEGERQICIENPDGSGRRPIDYDTSPPSEDAVVEYEGDPIWSPDGSRVAFVRQVFYPDDGYYNIKVVSMRADGSDLRYVGTGFRFSVDPAWQPLGSGAGAPNTTIVLGPSGASGASVGFDFVASKPGTDFECSLDGGSFRTCSPPQEYAGLAAGAHTFRVRAVDAAGNADPTPDQRTWTVDTTAPAVSGPTRGLLAGTVVGDSAVPVNLAWAATDSGSGVARYQLQQSANGGAFADAALPSETATSVATSLGAANTYQYRVRAQDGAGNWSAWKTGPAFAVDLRQEDYQAVSYAGTWALRSSPTASGGYVKYASAAGAKARFTFSGKNVAWVASTGSNRGKAEIWVDGTKAATVDLYSAAAQPRKILFTKSWGASGNHTIEVRVLGTKNAASTGKQVDVDAFVALR